MCHEPSTDCDPSTDDLISQQVMQDAFERKDMGRLQEALATMPIEEVKYHMKRCEDSGLWVTNA